MTAYATHEDLLTLHPDLEDVGTVQADKVLEMVSAAITALCDASSIDADVLRLVTCNAAARALQAGGPGIQSESWGASPFSGSVTFSHAS